jgi:hypothetical protein
MTGEVPCAVSGIIRRTPHETYKTNSDIHRSDGRLGLTHIFRINRLLWKY